VIVKIKFFDNRVMVFGTSYKSWEQQVYEYLCLCKNRGWDCDGYRSVEQSRQKWIGMGGLKWCSKEEFPKFLKEREDRDIADIKWEPMSKRTEGKLQKIGLTGSWFRGWCEVIKKMEL